MTIDPTDEDAIRKLFQEQVAAWNAGDAQGWCEAFTPDAGFVNILGMYFQGRDTSVRRHADLFAGIFKGSHAELWDLKVRRLGDATAIADAVFELTHFQSLPPGIRPTVGNKLLRTRMHTTLIREADHWRIVFSQNTAVMPMPNEG